MIRVLRIAVLLAGVSGLSAQAARADSVPLTGGFLDLTVTGGGIAAGAVELVGERGFSFAGSFHSFFAPPVGDPLPPGSIAHFDAAALGLDLPGTATLDGDTYSNVGGFVSPSSASLRFRSTVPLPSQLDAPALVVAPFLLDFDFFILDPERSSRVALFGSGFATYTLGEDLGFGVPSWRLTHVRAELSNTPIPEPSTLLLFGSAVGLAWARRRARELSRAENHDDGGKQLEP